MRVHYAQGTGGDEAQLSYTPAGGTSQPIPVTAAQPIPFSVLFAPDPLNLGNAVTVAASSTIQLTGGNFTTVSLGALTLNGNLSVTAQAGKKLAFSGATTTATGSLTLNDTADVGFVSSFTAVPFTPGTVNLSGVTLVKQGSGQLLLDNTSTSNPNTFTGSTIDLQAGRVVATGSGTGNFNADPLGTAAITIDGGTLSLDSRAGAATFDNAVNVNNSGTIEDQAEATTLSLGSPSTTKTVTIGNGKILTVNTFGGTPLALGNLAGATLQINEPIGGAGSLVENTIPFSTTANPGALILSPVSASTFIGGLTVNGGSVTDTAPNGLGAGSVVVNNGGQATINTGGTATTVTSFTVKSGGTLLVDDTSHTASRLSNTTALNLAGGTFTINGSAAASTNTTEALGAINVQSGFSTFNLNKGSGGNLTLSSTTLSLTTAGATVNFVGTGGTLGTAGDNLTFTTAPTATNGIIPYATVGGTDFGRLQPKRSDRHLRSPRSSPRQRSDQPQLRDWHLLWLDHSVLFPDRPQHQYQRTSRGSPKPVVLRNGCLAAELVTMSAATEPLGDTIIQQTVTVPASSPVLTYWTEFEHPTDNLPSRLAGCADSGAPRPGQHCLGTTISGSGRHRHGHHRDAPRFYRWAIGPAAVDQPPSWPTRGTIATASAPYTISVRPLATRPSRTTTRTISCVTGSARVAGTRSTLSLVLYTISHTCSHHQCVDSDHRPCRD